MSAKLNVLFTNTISMPSRAIRPILTATIISTRVMPRSLLAQRVKIGTSDRFISLVLSLAASRCDITLHSFLANVGLHRAAVLHAPRIPRSSNSDEEHIGAICLRQSSHRRHTGIERDRVGHPTAAAGLVGRVAVLGAGWRVDARIGDLIESTQPDSFE